MSHAQQTLSKWSSNSEKIIKLTVDKYKELSKKNVGGKKDTAADSNQGSDEIEDTAISGDNHLEIAKESLSHLLSDKRVPEEVRESLRDDFQQVEKMLEKIEQEHIHISVLGRVSVGKSSLLNALIGDEQFSTSPLHGETRKNKFASWHEYEDGGVYFIDTPGINEIDGEQRAKMAHDVATRSDIILFVVDGDMTETEYQALIQLVAESRPIVLVLNKADRYTQAENKALIENLSEKTTGLVAAENIVLATSRSTSKEYILVDEEGNETETTKEFPADVVELKTCLWSIIKDEGKTLAAINASLFAGSLSDQVADKIMLVRKDVAEKLIHAYCISKGVAVALNPIPITDLMAAAVIDVTLVVHLSKLYNLPLTYKEAGELIKTIAAQMLLFVGTILSIDLISSALKLGTGGLSTLLTASPQGAVAYYSTLVVGKAAQKYLRQGKSWGKSGAKEAVQSILNSLDRDSIMKQAKGDIMNRLKAGM